MLLIINLLVVLGKINHFLNNLLDSFNNAENITDYKSSDENIKSVYKQQKLTKKNTLQQFSCQLII